MVKRIAANRINTLHCLYCDAMVEINDGVVQKIVPLSELHSEPERTIFVNGTMSGADGCSLYVGYKGAIMINNETIIEQ